jgi:hypothetical protein
MGSTKRSPGSRGTLVFLACLALVLNLSLPGCSPAGSDATISPEVQAKAKENFKKRFANLDAAKKDRKISR